MFDKYNRHINYLRISITDRCNLRCVYCMPEEGIDLINHSDILSFEEIIKFVKTAVPMGIDKVRITGGEPLVRKGIVDFVKMLSEIEGIRDLSMTTNAVLLEDYALLLKNAGLRRVNISLDTINPEKFEIITRGGNLSKVLRGILKAKEADLEPVKINCVIKNSVEEEDAQGVADWCRENNLEVRFIKQMNLNEGVFSVVHGGSGGDCSKCNRLRLTSNGLLKPCLFSDISYDIRKIGYKNSLELALDSKPECGNISSVNQFYNIGG